MLAGNVRVPLEESFNRVTVKQRPEDVRSRECVSENEHLSLQFQTSEKSTVHSDNKDFLHWLLGSPVS